MNLLKKEDREMCLKTLVAWISCFLGGLLITLIVFLLYSVVVTSASETHIRSMQMRLANARANKINATTWHLNRLLKSVIEVPTDYEEIIQKQSNENPVNMFKRKIRSLVEKYREAGAEQIQNNTKNFTREELEYELTKSVEDISTFYVGDFPTHHEDNDGEDFRRYLVSNRKFGSNNVMPKQEHYLPKNIYEKYIMNNNNTERSRRVKRF